RCEDRILASVARRGAYDTLHVARVSESRVEGPRPLRRACVRHHGSRRLTRPEQLANKRLKLAGGDRSKGSRVLCAGAHELSLNYTARQRASGPQLKRDPLGSTQPLAILSEC